MVFSPGNWLSYPKPVTAGLFWAGLLTIRWNRFAQRRILKWGAGRGRPSGRERGLLGDLGAHTVPPHWGSHYFPLQPLKWCCLVHGADLQSVVLTTTPLLPRVKCLVGREYPRDVFYAPGSLLSQAGEIAASEVGPHSHECAHTRTLFTMWTPCGQKVILHVFGGHGACNCLVDVCSAGFLGDLSGKLLCKETPLRRTCTHCHV